MEEKGKLDSTITLVTNKSNEVSYIQRFLWLLNIVYYQVLAMVTIVIFWVFFGAYTLSATFLWHLVLSTAAYVPLMAISIILFSEDNLIALYIPRTRRYTIHGILLLISCAAISVGIALETNEKSQNGRPHFTSNHAILGLVSWILIFISVLIGLVTANTRHFSIFVRPIVLKLVHNILGLAAFAIGVGSLYLMLGMVEQHTSKTVGNATKYGVIFVTIWSGLAALKSLYFQFKGVFL